jgi:hypothetical protein
MIALTIGRIYHDISVCLQNWYSQDISRQSQDWPLWYHGRTGDSARWTSNVQRKCIHGRKIYFIMKALSNIDDLSETQRKIQCDRYHFHSGTTYTINALCVMLEAA